MLSRRLRRGWYSSMWRVFEPDTERFLPILGVMGNNYFPLILSDPMLFLRGRAVIQRAFFGVSVASHGLANDHAVIVDHVL